MVVLAMDAAAKAAIAVTMAAKTETMATATMALVAMDAARIWLSRFHVEVKPPRGTCRS